jgi:hypothetical protein
MIDISAALRQVPTFDRFCSIGELQRFVETLRRETARFEVGLAGLSENGLPIHHIRCGSGSVKALFVGFPHANEPIGGLTVVSLLTLLREGAAGLKDADVEWHIVPCIDPDGAALNEGWTQKPFTLGNYMRNFHRQELCDQAECSFPIKHKKLMFDRPTKEAAVLRELLTQIRPDFYYSLHNAWSGGAFYALSREIEEQCHAELLGLLRQYDIPIRRGAGAQRDGIYELATTRNWYDRLEATNPSPEKALQTGACSWEYLSEIKPDALTFIAELPYIRHPNDGSTLETAQSYRQLKLRIDAENKFLTTVILEEWAKVQSDLDASSPFYKKTVNGIISQQEKLAEGLPSWVSRTSEILFSPAFGKTMTAGELFETYQFDRFFVLCNSYEFVRLLKASPQTPPVICATARLEALLDEALEELIRNIDAERFQIIDCNTLARVQLGSGLIALNSVLRSEARHIPNV